MPQHYEQTMRAFAAERPGRAFIGWAVSGLLAAAWGCWFFLAGVTVHAVSDHARLEVAEAPSGVDAPVAGEVVSSGLVLGRSVREGETLLALDSRREALRLSQEELRRQSAAAKIQALEEEIAARRAALDEMEAAAREALAAATARAREARAAADFAAETEARVVKLAAEGVSPRAELRRAASERRRLEAAAAALDAEIRRTAGDAKAKAEAARADIARLGVEATALAGERADAGAEVARLEHEIARHILKAHVTGRLADVASLHAGSYVPEGQRLAVIVPEGRVQVIAEFAPSPVLGRVRAGQRAELRLDGFPWAQYGALAATVRRVDSELRDRMIRVELDLDPDAARSALVQHGLPGSVAVAVEEVTPAVLLLRAAGVVLGGTPAAAAVAP